MRKEDKEVIINSIVDQLNACPNFYLTDIEALNAEKTSQLRRQCFNSQVKLVVVKNALLKKAMQRTGKDFGDLYDVCKGTTAMMLSENGNAPAKLIKKFRKTSDKPILKGAYIEECLTHCAASSQRTNSSPTLSHCSSHQPRTLSALFRVAATSSAA